MNKKKLGKLKPNPEQTLGPERIQQPVPLASRQIQDPGESPAGRPLPSAKDLPRREREREREVSAPILQDFSDQPPLAKAGARFCEKNTTYDCQTNRNRVAKEYHTSTERVPRICF